MDEVAIVNEQMMEVDERVVEMNGRVGTLLDKIEELRRRNRSFELASRFGEEVLLSHRVVRRVVGGSGSDEG
jgi:hypothetical protein